MIELPEALNIAGQLNKTLAGKKVSRVLPPTKKHKFCWWNGEPSDYEKQIKDSSFLRAEGCGIYVDIVFDNGKILSINDGVNLRFYESSAGIKDYQLALIFTDGTCLIFTVAMYGGIVLHDGNYENEYYIKSRNGISPFSEKFEEYFRNMLQNSKQTMSAKAFLATEQRFPGIGNGVIQDILFYSCINPKRKLQTLDEARREELFNKTVSVLREMTDRGGRDTEKDIFGCCGGYRTKMSKSGLAAGCPVCSSAIVKETYLGGSIYYCPSCQPFEK